MVLYRKIKPQIIIYILSLKFIFKILNHEYLFHNTKFKIYCKKNFKFKLNYKFHYYFSILIY